eukprot:m.37566 g.37566  ORF g.37566 m.37566 type:complete len:606 (+) comp9328_c0_seq1:200-2017(+)
MEVFQECYKSGALARYAGFGAATAILGFSSWRVYSMYQYGFPYRTKAETSKQWYIKENSNVLVVGADDGVGLQIAIQTLACLNTGKLCVIGSGSLEDLLKKYKGDAEATALFEAARDNVNEKVKYYTIDLTSPTCGDVVDEAIKSIDVDVMIYAAGERWDGALSEETQERVEKTVHSVYTGFAITAKHVIKKMHDKSGGVLDPNVTPQKERKVVAVGSITSTLGTPSFATYSAAESALDSLVWSLKTELSPTNIAVQIIHCPVTPNTRSQQALSKKILKAVRGSDSMSVNFGSCCERTWLYLGWLLPHESWAFLYKNPITTALYALCHYVTTSLHIHSGPPPAKHILVTGSGRGLGEHLAKHILDGTYIKMKPGNHLYSYDIIEQPWKQDNVTCIKANLRTETTSSMQLPGAMPQGEPLDLVVCNAGFNIRGILVDLSDDQIRSLVEINLISPISMIAASLRHNKKLGKAPPTFLIISSLSQILSYPTGAVYSGAKEGVASYAKSLRKETRNPVYVVFPGPLRTQMGIDVSPDNSPERIQGRVPPSEAAATILTHIMNGNEFIWIGRPGILSLALTCSRDHVKSETFMRNFMLLPELKNREAQQK